MRNLISRTYRSLTLLFVLSIFLCAPASVSACPNCKLANESEANRPRAYMYSILFMIGMPATIFTGFGFGFYRMAKKAQAAAAADQAIEQNISEDSHDTE